MTAGGPETTGEAAGDVAGEVLPLDRGKLALARIWAVARQPYLAAALFACPVVAAPGLGQAATDMSWRLYVDPDEVERRSIPQLGSLLVHHTGHLLRDHAARAGRLGVGDDTAGAWALAADAEINDDLIPAGLLPPDPVLPQALGWPTGRLAEEYYRSDDHHSLSSPDCGSGSDGLSRPWELYADREGGLPHGLEPGEGHLLRCQVAADVVGYARQGRGRMPGGWRRWAEALLEPRLDWRTVLAGELRRATVLTAGRVDYTYRRPSRRAGVSPDVVLPALARPVPEVAVVCDTSGSMVEDQLAQALAEVTGLLRSLGTARGRVRVLAVDTSVKAARRVTAASQVELVGGGGTDMGTGVMAASRLRPRPSVVVVLTDGLTSWPRQAPRGVPVVVGLLSAEGWAGSRRPWDIPAWARVVPIGSDAPAA